MIRRSLGRVWRFANIPRDPASGAAPETSIYTSAQARRVSRERGLLRSLKLAMLCNVALTGLLAWLVSQDLRAGHDFAALMNQRQVYVLEKQPDGHQQVMALDNTMSVAKGARFEAAHWFMTWTRRLSLDPIAQRRDRDAARARLTEAAKQKWDAMVGADLKMTEGWTRDITDLTVQEAGFDPATRRTRVTLHWTERTFQDLKLRSGPVLLASSLLLQDVNPAPGLWDGVQILDFEVPTVVQDRRAEPSAPAAPSATSNSP